MSKDGCGRCMGCSASRWLTDKYIYVMLLIFPLFCGFSGYSSITAAKFWFFVIATGVWLAAVIFCQLLRALRCKNHERRPIRLKPAQWCVAAFMAVCCVSAAISPYGWDVVLGAGRYDGLVTLLLYGGIFLGVSFFGEAKRGYIFSLAISTALCCVVGILQLMDINALGLFPSGFGYYDAGVFYTGKFLGTIGNANLLGAFLCLSVPLCGAGFITGEKKSDAWLVIPVALGVFIVIATGSAGAAVGLLACALVSAPAVLTTGGRVKRALELLSLVMMTLALSMVITPNPELRSLTLFGDETPVTVFVVGLCGAFFFSLLANPTFKAKPKTFSRIFLCISAVCVVAFLTAAWYWPGESGAMYELSQVLRGNFDDSFGSSRLRIWKAVLALFTERPLLGGGPDTLALRLDIVFSRYVEETGSTLSTYVDNAHNEYLGYLANVGILGLGAYLMTMAFTFAGWVRQSRANGLVAAVGCALVSYWAQGFFGLGLCITAPMLWILWGLSQGSGAGAVENKTISEVAE